jgi:hypothetical protein
MALVKYVYVINPRTPHRTNPYMDDALYCTFGGVKKFLDESVKTAQAGSLTNQHVDNMMMRIRAVKDNHISIEMHYRSLSGALIELNIYKKELNHGY